MTRDSEAASEKPRRGRPPSFDYDRVTPALEAVFHRVRTQRGRQDILYRLRATKVLNLGIDARALRRGEPIFWKTWRALAPGVLTALGRIKSQKFMRACAEWFVGLQPPPRTVRDGERLVRWWRRAAAKELRRLGATPSQVRQRV